MKNQFRNNTEPKKLSEVKRISHTVTPDGWMPKPNVNHYSFLDWLTNFVEWECMIRKGMIGVNDAFIRAELRMGLK